MKKMQEKIAQEWEKKQGKDKKDKDKAKLEDTEASGSHQPPADPRRDPRTKSEKQANAHHQSEAQPKGMTPRARLRTTRYP